MLSSAIFSVELGSYLFIQCSIVRITLGAFFVIFLSEYIQAERRVICVIL